MASPASSSNGLQFDSLEDIHIFVLSNILRRPIIVIAGTDLFFFFYRLKVRLLLPCQPSKPRWSCLSVIKKVRESLSTCLNVLLAVFDFSPRVDVVNTVLYAG